MDRNRNRNRYRYGTGKRDAICRFSHMSYILYRGQVPRELAFLRTLTTATQSTYSISGIQPRPPNSDPGISR